MVYSVYNPQTQGYDYYEGPGDPEAIPSPKHLRPKELGIAAPQAGWPLPAGARWVGRGETARGQIATPLGGADLSSATSTMALLGLAAAAYLLWRHR